MASIAYRRGYGWSLPALDRASSPGGGGSEINQMRVFSAKGIAAPYPHGTFALPQIGTPIPGTNLVYIRPRLSQDELGGEGGSSFFPYAVYRWPGQGAIERLPGMRVRPAVHYTNPEFSFYREKRRTPSIGMAGAGQQGLTMDVPWQSEVPFFSVP